MAPCLMSQPALTTTVPSAPTAPTLAPPPCTCMAAIAVTSPSETALPRSTSTGFLLSERLIVSRPSVWKK